jgi:hypothetical protein
MSPEAASGNRVDHRSDLFSLGVVLVEMLTGRPLFDAENPVAILLAIRDGAIEPDKLQGVPPSLLPVAQRCLAHRAGDRWADARELRKALLQAAGRELQPMPRVDAALFMARIFMAEIELERNSEHDVDRRLEEDPGLSTGEDQVQPYDDVFLLAPVRVLADDDLSRLGEPTPAAPRPVPRGPSSSADTVCAAVPDRAGDLALESLAGLLHELADAGEKGRIDFRRDPVQKSVFLDHGQPVYAISNLENELLGEHLVARGLLTREQHGEAVRLAQAQGMRLIESLLELGFFPTHELFSNLADQIRERILELFTWSNGSYRFYRDLEPPEAGVPLNLRTHVLVHDGVFQRLPLAVIHRAFEDRLRCRPRRWPSPLPQDLVLSGREQRLVRLIEAGAGSVADLIRQERSEEQVLRLLYLLDSIGCVSFEDARHPIEPGLH